MFFNIISRGKCPVTVLEVEKIMMIRSFYMLLAICSFSPTGMLSAQVVNKAAGTIATRFQPPDAYERKPSAGFGEYLRNLPLHNDGKDVLLYDGTSKNRQDVHAAVLKVDVGDKNLQQCADAVMRLRAEYLYSKRQYDKIHFRFTNGFNAEFDKWQQGYRIVVRGNDVTWAKDSRCDDSYSSFRKYLDMVFTYAGTLSLSRELMPVTLSHIAPGDVFIHGGSPGHAVIVVDVAVSVNGEKLFMLAQSYMPAQEIHLLKNFQNPQLSPWYGLKECTDNVYTPEWTFPVHELKRFE